MQISVFFLNSANKKRFSFGHFILFAYFCNSMKQHFATFRSAILAGLCISIGCIVNLRVGGIGGAVLFSFGLLAVVHYTLKLYTGTAGFIRAKGDWDMLLVVLLGNIVGCALTAATASYALPAVSSDAIVQSRFATGAWGCGLLAIGCGFIMTTAVQFARKSQFLPLLFGVPVFILCGFTHSIADAFYFCLSPQSWGLPLLVIYLSEVLGNFVGCNLYRWVMQDF